MANEIDELEEFLKVAPPVSAKENVHDLNQSKEIQENGNTTSREVNIIKNYILSGNSREYVKCYFLYYMYLYHYM